jgi:hypothetical protein
MEKEGSTSQTAQWRLPKLFIGKYQQHFGSTFEQVLGGDMDLDSVNFSVIALTNTNRARLSEGAIREEQRDAERRTNGRETWHL